MGLARLIEQPLNSAWPSAATTALASHVRTAPGAPVPGLIDSATRPPTPLPPASVAVTTGCVANGAPPGPPLGLVVNATTLAPPAVTSKDVLTAEVSDGDDAVRV